LTEIKCLIIILFYSSIEKNKVVIIICHQAFVLVENSREPLNCYETPLFQHCFSTL